MEYYLRIFLTEQMIKAEHKKNYELYNSKVSLVDP